MAKSPKPTSSTAEGRSPDARRRFDATFKRGAVALSKRIGIGIGFGQSMSKTGCCYDNAVAESFFHSLKVEWIHGHGLRDREAIRSEVFCYIEGDYHRPRHHSTLGYVSPAEFERRAMAAA